MPTPPSDGVVTTTSWCPLVRSKAARRLSSRALRPAGRTPAASAIRPCASWKAVPASGCRTASAQPTDARRSEEHTSELQSLMRNSYAVFCLQIKKENELNSHQYETL